MARVSESMSWERTACAAADGAGEQLLVFGYSARLFQDDAQASLVDEGGCLVPCPGREDVLIDRSVAIASPLLLDSCSLTVLSSLCVTVEWSLSSLSARHITCPLLPRRMLPGV